MKRVFLAVAFMSALSIQASATDYYVSKGGRDSNNGTSPATAWKTINKVNRTDFGPGDSILFKGGQSFSGNLYFDGTKIGTASSPLTIGSYDTGRATINAGNRWGIYIYNAAGVDIINIDFVGSGSTVNTSSGIAFYSDAPVKPEHIHINGVDVRGFGGAGVSVVSDVGYRDVRVTNSTLHDNMKAGFMTWVTLALRNVHENVYVAGVTAYNNTGIATEDAGYPSNDGSGIWFVGVSGGTIENSAAYNNGALCNWEGACAGGIWAIYSTGITIQNNEAHNNKTNGPYDGGGFDLDKSVRNSVMQYNYSHDNDGVGYMLCCGEPDHYGNVVRYNVSENDGRKNSQGGIAIYGNVGAAEIYGNTIRVTPSASGSPSAVLASSGAAVRFLNNTFTTTGDLPQVRINYTGANRLFFQGNQYLNNFKVITPSGTYFSIEAWREAEGQEPLSSV